VRDSDDVRRAELAANLARVRTRIADACVAAGRDRSEVTLVAVTKTYPAQDVLYLAGLGVRDIGENRDQDAGPKAVAVAAAGESVRWHFVGQLQRNKCRSVAGYAHLVHSVDRSELVVALSRARQRFCDSGAVSEPLGVLLQISVDDDPERGGVVADDLDRLADETAAQPYLSLRGVMTVAPIEWSPDRAFFRLAELAQRLKVRYPTATVVSAGMSGDLESAVAFGATHVRIGSALLGNRPTLR
jgi:pyridoxal phosphate enzyme (YggS family)